MWACAGMESTLRSSCRNELSIVENSVQKSLDHRFHVEGSWAVGVQATSVAKRWVTLWRVHILKIRSIVCLLERPSKTFLASSAAALTRLSKKALQNLSDPRGTPSTRRPVVTSHGLVSSQGKESLLDLSMFSREYVWMADDKEACVVGSASFKAGRMLSPVVVVKILVFSVFMSQPRGSATSLKASKSGLTSSSGTRKLASST